MPLGVDPTSKDQPRVNRDLTEAIRQLWQRTNSVERTLAGIAASVDGLKVLINSLIDQPNNITRITVADSPYSVQLFDRNIYADTDGGAITISMRPGVHKVRLTVKNCGSSGNDVTLVPNGTDLLFGTNASFAVIDSEVFDMQYETTEGWR